MITFATGGVNKVMDLFTAKGGTNLGAMIEGLAQTDIGKDILNKVSGNKEASEIGKKVQDRLTNPETDSPA